MGIEFFFRIDAEEINYKRISSALGLLATRDKLFWEFSSTKIMEIELFVKNFLEKLDAQKGSLNSIGVNVPEDISFWYLYEYEEQCNIEFDYTLLELLGSKRINLCISCWKENDYIKYNP